MSTVARPLHESGKSVLIVSHGVACMSIVSIFRGTQFDSLWDILMKNCELVHLL